MQTTTIIFHPAHPVSRRRVRSAAGPRGRSAASSSAKRAAIRCHTYRDHADLESFRAASDDIAQDGQRFEKETMPGKNDFIPHATPM